MNTEQKWIKTADRVPRNNGEYLITYVYGDGTVSVGTAEYDGAHWTIHGRDAYDAYIYERYPILVLKNGKTPRGTKISVVAWMPMPEPYKFDVVDLECAHWDDTQQQGALLQMRSEQQGIQVAVLSSLRRKDGGSGLK